MVNNISYAGPGFVSLLTLVFAVAKLWGKIDWSWWWVFSPLWITASILLFITIVVIIVAAIVD